MKAKLNLKLAFLSSTAFLGLIAAGCNNSTDTQKASSTSIASFVSSYNDSLRAPQNINGAVFLDLIDDAFLDDGYRKADLKANLQADADGVAAAPTQLAFDSIYPVVGLEEATVAQCDDNSGICQMTATYVNAAPDSTRLTLTVPVRFQGGKFRLYGNQAS